MKRLNVIFLAVAITLTGLLSACGGDSAPPPPVATVVILPTHTPTDPVPAATPIPPTDVPPETPAPPADPSPTTEAAAEMATSTPIPPPPPTATPLPPSFPPTIALTPWLDHPNQLTYLTHAGDGSGRVFIVEKQGRVLIVQDGVLLPTPFLDISARVKSDGFEQGLLSVAFPPDFAQSGQFYANYTAAESNGNTIIARYQVSSADPNVADSGSETLILQIEQPAANHNGGQIQFGPDGYLYIGTGDGGQANDPWDNAENLNALLGKMLRIQVRGEATYAVPGDNPFVGQADVRPEIWAYGLRNPWRFSFDRTTGDLYIADVGQNVYEEINVQPFNSAGGEHYGWDTMEGFHCFEPDTGCDETGKTLPVAEYDHGQGCSVTGGYVYRGVDYPALQGTYFYADYCNGNVWGLRFDPQTGWQDDLLLQTSGQPASFGEDEVGELYLLDLSGQIYRLIAQ